MIFQNAWLLLMAASLTTTIDGFTIANHAAPPPPLALSTPHRTLPATTPSTTTLSMTNDEEPTISSTTNEPHQQQSPKKPKKKKTPPPPPAETTIDISKLDLRVGIITNAWHHPEGDKLFCEEIDIGEEGGPRKIASGLRAHYGLEALVGQRVLVVANLKTRKLVGFPSHGMVMCASNGDGSVVEFVEPPPEAAIGERVSFEGYEGDPASENQVIKKKMLDVIFPELKTDDGGVATYKGVPFTTVAGVCKAQSGLKNAAVS